MKPTTARGLEYPWFRRKQPVIMKIIDSMIRTRLVEKKREEEDNYHNVQQKAKKSTGGYEAATTGYPEAG